MGTRSRIGVMHGDIVKSVYCHWDGYLAYNGKMLQEHYNSARANELVALGDLSSLQPEIGETHPFGYHGTDMSNEEYQAKFGNMCTFYGRDRGETGTEFKVSHTFAEFLEQCDNCGAEYYYINKDGVWYVGTTYSNSHSLSRSLTALSEALAKEEEEEAVAE
jgi:hypothetical protein